MNLFASIKALLTNTVRQVNEAAAEADREYRAAHPPEYDAEAQWKPKDTPAAAPAPKCGVCGSEDFDSDYSNSHARCRQCGAARRKDRAQWETMPPVPQRPQTYVKTTFRNGAPAIIEYELRDEVNAAPDITRDREVGWRAATKQDMAAKPKPVAFHGIRAGRPN